MLDTTLPEAEELIRNIKLNRRTNSIPIIALSSLGDSINSQFRVVPDQSLEEPVEMRQLLETAESELARSAEEEALFDQQLRLELDTTDPSVRQDTELCGELIRQAGFESEDQISLHCNPPSTLKLRQSRQSPRSLEENYHPVPPRQGESYLHNGGRRGGL